jgi:hypothetical protein
VNFSDGLASKDVPFKPKEGINNTAPPIEVVNEKTGRYLYIALPTYTDDVSPNTVKKLVTELGIEPPKSF